MTASNDNQFFPGIINGVYIDTSGLDIVSLLRKVVLIKKYKDEADKERWKRIYDGAFDDGVYFGMIDYAEKLYDENVEVEDGDTSFSLMLDPKYRRIEFYVSQNNISVGNAYNKRVDEFCHNNFELNFPEKFEIRFFDIKNNLICSDEFNLNNRNTNFELIFSNNLVKYEFSDERLARHNNSEVIVGNMQRSYEVLLAYATISYIYLENEDNPIEYEFTFDNWMFASEEVVLNRSEGNVLVVINIKDDIGQFGATISKYNNVTVQSGRYYSVKEFNLNDIEPLFLNRENVEVDLQLFNLDRFCWLSFEDKLLSMGYSNANLLNYLCYIGNFIQIITNQ